MPTANKLFFPKLFQLDLYPGCRRSAWAGQAGEVVWYEEVPAKRGEGAEEGLPGPEEAGVPGDYEDENVSLAKIPIDYIAIFVFLRYTYQNYMLVCTIIGNTGKSSLIQRPDCFFVFSVYQQWLLWRTRLSCWTRLEVPKTLLTATCKR